MPKKPAIPHDPYRIGVSVKLNEAALRVLDDLRGSQTRSAFIRSLIRDERQRKGQST